MATPFDYNGDGFSDVFWVNGVTGQNLIWNMVNDTFNSQQVPAGITVPDNAISISGDFNGNEHHRRFPIELHHRTKPPTFCSPMTNPRPCPCQRHFRERVGLPR